MLKALIEEGHTVICYVTDCPEGKDMHYEGVHLVPVRNVTMGMRSLRTWRPDVVLSHHQNSAMVNRYANQMRYKSVYLTHNDMDVNKIPLRMNPALVVHNSEWVKESLNQRYSIARDQMVVHPPLDCSRHSVDKTGKALTLININEHKGGKIFIELAQRMSDLQFQAVVGGHGIQVKMPHLRNLTVVPHTPDLKTVWSNTRLLLMPSVYESYGLVGIEAGCSGIPTLANRTPGLVESLGDSGQFVMERDNIDEWEVAIRAILEDWDSASASARANSQRLCDKTSDDLRLFVKAVENLPQR